MTPDFKSVYLLLMQINACREALSNYINIKEIIIVIVIKVLKDIV
jgi:hypothetical protein